MSGEEKKEYIERGAALLAITGQPTELHYPDWYKGNIMEVPAADVAPVVHGVWIATTKHRWKTDENGEVDEFAWDNGFHNGTVCTICGFTPCVHCNSAWEKDDRCREHFICSVCGLHVEEKYPYCHCGAKMDGRTYTLAEVKAELGLE